MNSSFENWWVIVLMDGSVMANAPRATFKLMDGNVTANAPEATFKFQNEESIKTVLNDLQKFEDEHAAVDFIRALQTSGYPILTSRCERERITRVQIKNLWTFLLLQFVLKR